MSWMSLEKPLGVQVPGDAFLRDGIKLMLSPKKQQLVGGAALDRNCEPGTGEKAPSQTPSLVLEFMGERWVLHMLLLFHLAPQRSIFLRCS